VTKSGPAAKGSAETIAGEPTGAQKRNRSIGDAFSAHNSLNFLRLVLALCVIFSHAILLGGFGNEGILHKTTLGAVAVYGFFGISGFLIAGSAVRNGFGRYLWQRFLRIFPAFWVCLLVTAFILAAIAWQFGGQAIRPHCGLSCYLSTTGGPFSYVLHNSWLRVNQASIAGTPHGIPEKLAWNGSLWTLFYEFLCYLILGVLAIAGFLRRKALVVAFAAAVFFAETVIVITPALNMHFQIFENWDAKELLTFVPIFLSGALLYLYRERVPDSGLLALACTGLFLLSLVVPVGAAVPSYTFTSTDLFAPLLAYPLLWLGIHLPFQRVGAQNDYSYGVYIYAFPVQQLLALGGVQRWGYPAYALLGAAATFPLAIASWWLVEKHALKLKKADFRWVPGRSVRSTAPLGVATADVFNQSGEPDRGSSSL